MKKWILLIFITPVLWAFDQVNEFHSLESEIDHVPLHVEGEIPHWIEGTYIRNGPSKFQSGNQAVTHWFDGLAMLHAFHIEHGKCSYSNRFLRTNAYQAFISGYPPESGFSKTDTTPMEALEGEFYPKRPNAVVNVAQFDHNAVALTESPTPVIFDLESLETLGTFEFEDVLAKKNCYETAHFHQRGEKNYGYLVKIGPTSEYQIYEMEGRTRKELCSIHLNNPSYVHSFSMTDHYIIFIDYPLRLNFNKLLDGTGFIQSFDWEEEGSSYFYIIDRSSGKLLKSLEGPPFFSFHHINAYEEENHLVVDLIGYSDAQVIMGKGDNDAGWYRFVIDDAVTCAHFAPMEAELPRIHYEKHNGSPYRYFYATCFRRSTTPQESPPLYKVDTHTGKVLTWSIPGHFASEPVFIPNPNGAAEDDGMIVSIITNHDHTHSFLLLLDGVTFNETARIYTPHGIPQGLHGQFFQ